MDNKDHDLLIEINERTKSNGTLISNHLRHHFAFNMVMMASMLGLITAMILLILNR